jgi:hypothetical protein
MATIRSRTPPAFAPSRRRHSWREYGRAIATSPTSTIAPHPPQVTRLSLLGAILGDVCRESETHPDLGWGIRPRDPGFSSGVDVSDERIPKTESPGAQGRVRVRGPIRSPRRARHSPRRLMMGQLTGVRGREGAKTIGTRRFESISRSPGGHGHVDQIVAPFTPSAESGLIGRRPAAANACGFRSAGAGFLSDTSCGAETEASRAAWSG